MNVRFAHAAVHTPEQVREIIREARVIAAEQGDDLEVQVLVFREACTLLGARASVPLMDAPARVELPAMTLPNGRR